MAKARMEAVETSLINLTTHQAKYVSIIIVYAYKALLSAGSVSGSRGRVVKAMD